jgi:hypothetical protein
MTIDCDCEDGICFTNMIGLLKFAQLNHVMSYQFVNFFFCKSKIFFQINDKKKKKNSLNHFRIVNK